MNLKLTEFTQVEVIRLGHNCTFAFGVGGGVVPMEAIGLSLFLRLEGVGWVDGVRLCLDVLGKSSTSLSLPDPTVRIVTNT